MATIIRNNKLNFVADPNKADYFRLFSDIYKKQLEIKTVNLNFDIRQLNPGQFSAPYHFHRHAEELFMISQGSMTLRTPKGFEIVERGDVIYFEMGESGAHQFYNHASEPCIYLDVRTFIGYDVCEYPDTGKVLFAPSFEIFNKSDQKEYFDGEEKVKEKWKISGNNAG